MLLRLGASAEVQVTGLRNACSQLDKFRPELMAAVLERAPDGKRLRKDGVMGIVVAGGEVRAGDPIEIELPVPPQRPLEPV